MLGLTRKGDKITLWAAKPAHSCIPAQFPHPSPDPAPKRLAPHVRLSVHTYYHARTMKTLIAVSFACRCLRLGRRPATDTPDRLRQRLPRSRRCVQRASRRHETEDCVRGDIHREQGLARRPDASHDRDPGAGEASCRRRSSRSRRPTVEEAIARRGSAGSRTSRARCDMTSQAPGHAGMGRDRADRLRDERRGAADRHRRGSAKGKTYYVTLIDGAVAAAERRGAQLNIADRQPRGRRASRRESRGPPRARARCRPRSRSSSRSPKRRASRRTCRASRSRSCRTARSCSRKASACASAATNEPVTPSTLFMIGSMTKPLTSLMMARLVDRRQFAWETPITKLMPAFALGDPDGDRARDDGAYRVRVHGAAAMGHGVHLRIERIDARVAHRAGARDEADDRLRRDLPVQQPHGGPAGTSPR